MLGSLVLAALALNFSIKTSIYDLVGMSDTASISSLRAGADNKIVLICEASGAERSRREIQTFVDSLPKDYRQPENVESLARIPALADKVCPEDVELLRTKEGRAKIAKKAIRRYVASPMPPMFRPEEDPFCLKEHFLMSFASDKCAIQPLALPDAIAGDIDRLIEVVADLRARIASANAEKKKADPTFLLSMTGVPVHTAVTAGACKRQIGALTWFSLGFIALLSIFVFRSVKWIPLLALSLALSCAAGATAIFIFFDSVHIMTLVFGTTVLGLVIDYSFHWLLSPQRDARLTRNLVISWLTTEISLVPLLVSSLPVLRQTAVFLAFALAAALAFVVFAYPKRGKASDLVLASLALALGVWGCNPVRTDPKAIYHAPSELAAADRILAEKWQTRVDVRDLVAKLYEEQGEKVKAALGLSRLVYERPAATAQPQRILEDLLNRLTRETMMRLAMALGFMLVALVVFFRRRAIRMFLPSAFALTLIFGGVALVEGAVNLFHLIAMFLLLGMSIDYTVFLLGGGKASLKPALCSLLTSMAGFGALSIVSFPVVRAFGFVLGLGLPLAFLFAFLLSLSSREAKESSTEHGASLVGMEILFALYRAFGLRALHLFAQLVGMCLWLFSPAVRKASPRLAKVRSFTQSLSDKLVVMAEGRRLPCVVPEDHPDAVSFLENVRSGKGVFVLSSHVGTIEVLTALGACDRVFHAWMDFDRTGVFNRFYLRHAHRRRVVIHPVSEFGLGTVFEAGDLIDGGDCLLMAGDRGDGAFRFAAAFDHPVYFVACVSEGGLRYRAIIRRLPSDRKAMKASYDAILGELAKKYRDQHFTWG